MSFHLDFGFLRQFDLADRKCRRRANHTGRLSVERLEDRQMPSIDLSSIGVWTERGPGPIADSIHVDVGGSFVGNPVSGAVEALAPHPTNKDILYAGTVNGGVWKTNFAYTVDPEWIPLTDQMPSLSIGALAFSPKEMDPTFNTLFAGIGHTSNAGRAGGPLTGIIRTTDGGTTWQQLGPELAGLSVESVVPTKLGGDPAHQVVLVAARGRGGIYRSVDGGAHFGTTPVLVGNATQLVADPGNPNRFYAGVAGEGVYLITDDGTAVSSKKVSNGLGNVGDSIRIELAVGDDGHVNFVYAALVGSSGKLSGVYRSANQGASWTVMGDSGFGDPDPPGINDGSQQGGVNLSLTVNPHDPTDVYIGGDENGTTHISTVSEWDGEWNQITGLFDRPHGDSRDMVFDAAGQLLEADDGGIYRHVDRDHWDSVTGSLRITEFNSIAYDALNNIVFGGTQDNARAEETNVGGVTSSYLKVWSSWGLGDGGNVGIGYITEDGVRKAVRYGIGNNLQTHLFGIGNNALERHVYRAGNQLDNDEDGNLNGLDDPDADFDGFHQFPLAVNAFDGNRLLLGGYSLYESMNNGDDFEPDIPLLPGNGGDVGNTSAIVYGGRFNGVANPDVIYASFANNLRLGSEDPSYYLYVRSTAGSLGGHLEQVRTDPEPGFKAIDIALDPDDWHRAYVTNGRKIYFTHNAGDTAWDDITFNLPNLQADRINAIDVYSPTTAPGDETVLVATDAGVFRLKNGVWSEVGANLPNVIVTDLHYSPEDNLLVAGTLGRGAWVMENASTVMGAHTLTITPGFSLSGNTRTRIGIDPNNPLLLAVSSFSPFAVGSQVTTTVPLDGVDQIIFDGASTNDSLTIDFTNGNPIPAGGIDFDGSFGTDTLSLAGTLPANPVYTLIPAVFHPAFDETLTIGASTIRFKSAEFVTPFTPAVSNLQLSGVIFSEGDTVTITGQFIDPGTLSSHTVVIDWGNDVTTTNLAVGARLFSVTHQGIEEGGLLSVTVIDNDNLMGKASAGPVTVSDPPVVAQGASLAAVRGAPLSLFVATFTDPGGAEIAPTLRDHYTATINWGDNSASTAGSLSYGGAAMSKTDPFSVFGTHTYTTNGTLTVRVTINHEGVQTITTSTVLVSSVVNHPNALAGPLVIGASQAGDAIRVNPVGTQTGATTDSVEVFINGVSQGTFTGFNRIEIYGQDGNDDLELSPGILKKGSLFGGKGDDTLVGSAGGDSLIGGPGNDMLTGNDGNDFLEGDTGNDRLDGGAGVNILVVSNGAPGIKPLSDSLNIESPPPPPFSTTGATIRVAPVGMQTGAATDTVQVTINGIIRATCTGFGTITVNGSDGKDNIQLAPGIRKSGLLLGGKEDDLLAGSSGNDTLIGGDGDDTLGGSDGNDLLQGDDGNDSLFGGNGNDTLRGGNGNDKLDGGAGTNILDAGPQLDGVVIRGTAGDDRIEIGWRLGAKGAQVVVNMNGQTQIEDYRNGETIFVFAGKGNDFVRMLPSADGHWTAEFHGEDGNDILLGAGMNDILDGGNGNDVLVGGPGSDILVGGAGNDNLNGGNGEDTLSGGHGNDTLIGGTGDDVLRGGAGKDRLDGGPGNNTLDGGPGQDGVNVRGTSGNDSIAIGWQLGQNGPQLIVEMNGKTSIEDYANGETIFVFAGNGSDFVQMLPSGGAHWKAEFHGEQGNDLLVGSDKSDLLDGGPGRNVLIGGRGADVLNSAGSGDVLIPGQTAWDADPAALAAVLTEWSSGRSSSERIANLTGAGTSAGANSNTFLKVSGPNVTMFDDGVPDIIVGPPVPSHSLAFARRTGPNQDIFKGVFQGDVKIIAILIGL